MKNYAQYSKWALLSIFLFPPAALAAQSGPESQIQIDSIQQQSPDVAWQALASTLKDLPEQISLEPLASDPLYRADFYLTALMTVTQATLATAQQDSRHPDWIPFTSKSLPIIAPNPDTVYHVSRIASDGVYRLSGYRGTVRLVDIQVSRGLWGLVDRPGPTLLNINLDSQKIDSDGRFELILSAERPVNFTGNWVKLDSRADFLFVRQVAYDWENEIDARFAIERLDIPARKERPSAQWIAEQIDQSSKFVKRLIKFNHDNHEKIYKRMPNVIYKLGTESNDASLNLKQVYYQGWFSAADNEAIIFDTNVPNCKYWSFQITDNWGKSIDYMHRQSSLNGFTASTDADGRLRMVLSSRDPGVPNWIDTSNYPTGVMLTRWYDCDGEPKQNFRKISFEKVRQILPRNTPRIDKNQREVDLHKRIRGAQLRRRW